MTQYLLSVHGSEDQMRAVPPEQMQQAFEQVDRFNADLQAQGVWVYANGLHPARTATVVKVVDGETIITDGPYLEAKEHIGGFWIIEVADLDEALEWARRASIACLNPVEVRPFQSE